MDRPEEKTTDTAGKPQNAIGRALKRLFSVNKLFSRCIVLICIVYMVRVTENAMDMQWAAINAAGESGTYQFYYFATAASDLIKASIAFFGGELLLLAFKDVITSAGTAAVEKVKAAVKKATGNKKRDC